ncbi:DUF2141 domain-containing protein [Polaribacter marinivivus]|jgi:uncharacterized protein (DUF2141 family)|uniref:DUF2141 domain-containing protein n=1 Tax=Polaribacter marinivivus TaxID=1524260 RepID=A0ABV8R9G0_9FLAO|nr:DUF2141 domain-containing protein [uncultured Polaribacter sp.]
MKKILLLLAIIFLGTFSLQAQEETFDLKVEITGMDTDKGKVFLALYNSEATFLKKSEDTKGANAIVKDKRAIAIFKGLKKGEYAISLFHDENDNNKMDTKIFGIPKEPYGFSNDAKGFMGPPKFKDAKFIVDTNKTITIKVN